MIQFRFYHHAIIFYFSPSLLFRHSQEEPNVYVQSHLLICYDN